MTSWLAIGQRLPDGHLATQKEKESRQEVGEEEREEENNTGLPTQPSDPLCVNQQAVVTLEGTQQTHGEHANVP